MAAERDLSSSGRERALNDLGELARNGFSDQASDIAHQAGKRRLRTALEHLSGGSKRAQRGIWLGLAAAAALTSIALFLFLRASAPAPLSFEVDPKLAQGEYLQPPVSGPNAAVRFSDGSELQLNAGGRARVASTSASGAQLVLERGHAALHVVHRPNTHWSFAAGPYKVLVTGTRFTVDWRTEEEQLQVVVTEGSVLVQSSGKQEGIAVRAGQRLVATAKDERFALEPMDGTNAPAGAEPPAAQSEPDYSQIQAPASSTIPSANSDTWSKRVAAGDFAGVLGAAQARGVPGVLTQAPLPDLVALADAARYTSNVQLAQQALTAQRNRFAASSSARAAAFLMGRIAEDQRHDSTGALTWYNTYLSEAPQGAFAAEALGRRLVLLERTAGAAAARDSARSYLRRFPDGPYARVAQQILSAP
ncbi:MAG TPA: FecR family protein [Polyangiaceae bacterium]|nr:FecR family protein [Polyangiaceae bacterium]